MAESAPHPDTVQFIYEHTRDSARNQFGTMDALDAKATQMFAAAAVIVGFAAVAAVPRGTGFSVGLLGVLLGVGAFLTTAFLTTFTLRPYDVFRSDHGETMWPTYKGFTPDQIREKLAEEMPGIVQHNQHVIEEKAGYVRGIAVALAAEATFVIVGVILNAVGGISLF